MPRPFVKAVALSGAVAASALFAFSANAAQVLKPKSTAGAVLASQDGSGTVSVPIGQTLFFDVEYSVTGSQSKDEAGIGLKIGYDTSFFDLVVPSTAVTALHTKCMIASPSDQATTGTLREVVFGWIDTSIRTTPSAGAVGWPGTADPASPGTTNGCLNPGSIVTESGSLMASNASTLNLFRIGLKAKNSGVSVGATSTVTINTAGNISYATTGNVDTSKTINVVAAAAPACNLDADGNGTIDPFVDGILILRYLLNVGNATFANGAVPQLPRNTAALVKAYLATQNLSVAGLVSDTPDPFVDGIVILRLMLGVGNTTLLNGVTLPPNAPAGATPALRAAAIRAQANSRCGTSF